MKYPQIPIEQEKNAKPFAPMAITVRLMLIILEFLPTFNGCLVSHVSLVVDLYSFEFKGSIEDYGSGCYLDSYLYFSGSYVSLDLRLGGLITSSNCSILISYFMDTYIQIVILGLQWIYYEITCSMVMASYQGRI